MCNNKNNINISYTPSINAPYKIRKPRRYPRV